MSAKTPDEVFTPRAANVNAEMYVARPELEDAVRQALRGTQHLVIHGESGTGKSWLYKHVFAEEDVVTVTVNMALASKLGSLDAAFSNIVDREGSAEKTGFQESKSAGLMGTGLSHSGDFVIGRKEPFERLLVHCRREAGKRRALLVFENLERAFDRDDLVSQIGDVLILLDDDVYAEYSVRVALVGVPSDVRRYFSQSPNLSTVANRLTEIPEVSRLSVEQARDLVVRGLFVELGYEAQDGRESVLSRVLWVTDRIPQQVQEYCLEIARCAEVNAGLIDASVLDQATRRWGRTSLLSSYTAIEAVMNARKTSAGRRNQVIYALGRFDGNEFRYSDIEQVVRETFPDTAGVALNVSGSLAELAGTDTPIIKRTAKGDDYRFVNPKYRMCIRAMLHISDGRVEKLDLQALVE